MCVFESCSLTSHPSPQSELRWSTMGFDPRLTNEPRPKRWWYKLQLHHTLSVHTCSWMCDTSIDTTDKLGRSVDTVTHAHWTRDTSIGTRASGHEHRTRASEHHAPVSISAIGRRGTGGQPEVRRGQQDVEGLAAPRRLAREHVDSPGQRRQRLLLPLAQLVRAQPSQTGEGGGW